MIRTIKDAWKLIAISFILGFVLADGTIGWRMRDIINFYKDSFKYYNKEIGGAS